MILHAVRKRTPELVDCAQRKEQAGQLVTGGQTAYQSIVCPSQGLLAVGRKKPKWFVVRPVTEGKPVAVGKPLVASKEP